MSTGSGSEHVSPAVSIGGLTRRRFLGSAAAVGAVAASGGLLTACGDSPEPSAPVGKAKKGGTLTVATGGAKGGDTLDPMLLNSVPTAFMSRSLYSQLADFTNTLEYRLHMAESIESNKNADEWTIRLKPDIEFHDGKTLDADDVIFTFERTFDLPGAVTVGKFKGVVDVKQIKKLDDRTLRLKLLKPSATFHLSLASPFKIIPVGFDPKNPVGNGPFKYDSFTANRQWVLDRFPNYWDGEGEAEPSDSAAPKNLGARPYVDRLQVNVINDDSARVNALITGQVDAINLLPYAQIPLVEKRKELKVLESKTGAWTGVYMNMDEAPFDDVRVRQALRLSVDREQALQSALSGHGTLAYDLPEPFDAAYPKSLTRKRDVTKARALLKEAGHENVKVELVTGPVSVEAQAICTVLAENAAEAGFDIKVRKVDTGTLFGPQFHSWKFSVDKWPAQGDYLTLMALTTLSDSDLTHTDDKDKNELRELYHEAQGNTDEKARNELKAKMYQNQFERGGWIIPFFSNVENAYSEKTAGWAKNDVAGRTFGNGRFDQVYRTE